jgi:hypothetical protein
VVGLLGVVALVIWRWPQLSPPAVPSKSQTVAQACGLPSASSVPANLELKISEGGWSSQPLQVGQTVQWLNDADVAATIISTKEDGGQKCDGFSAITVPPGQEFQLTMLRQGSWYFEVKGMNGKGVIVVH